MIRLTRTTPEPAALKETRDVELPKARAAAAAGGKGVDGKAFTFKGYGKGKQQLFKDQSHKCAYCEKREEAAGYLDTEHYRPKDHYWWLAWTWENLLFACAHCNRAHKKSQFPLADESTRLVAEAAPPGNERPLLIDPFDPQTDPRDHIVFRREVVQRHERWRPHGRTERGRTTIHLCGLDRSSLLDLYRDHVTRIVRPACERFTASRVAAKGQEVAAAWSTLVRTLFAPGLAFHALSRDAVEHIVPLEVRLPFKLDLP